ncbi:MAG: S8 family serine peptidase [bacterium]
MSIKISLWILLLLGAGVIVVNAPAAIEPFKIQPEAAYVPDELLVKFKSGCSAMAVEAINTEVGARNLNYYPEIGVTRVKLTEKQSMLSAISTYAKYRDKIEYAEPNYYIHLLQTPNDPSFTQQWNFNNTGQTGGTPDADIDAPEAWNISIGDSTFIIGVIDTGIDNTHPDLINNIWHNPDEIPFNGIDDDGNGYVDDTIGWNFGDNNNDVLGINAHGTHVAGIIAARGNNGIGVTGVMWQAKLMVLRMFGASGGGTEASAISAILYSIQKGAKLTSNSWTSYIYHTQAMYDTISTANEAGQLFIAGAGNNALNNDSVRFYPACYDLPNIISVAATTATDVLWSSSNYGPTTIDVAAPGAEIYSTLLNGGYGLMSGTSMSTPHVSGECGLIWSINTSLSNLQVKQIVMDTVDVIPALTGKCVANGRINLFKAAQAAVESIPASVPPQEYLLFQ